MNDLEDDDEYIEQNTHVKIKVSEDGYTHKAELIAEVLGVAVCINKGSMRLFTLKKTNQLS